MAQPAKHTPGPWATFGPTKFQIYGGDPVRRIAVLDYTTGSETDEHVANANLIAAAPAMYEALQEIDDQLDQFTVKAQEDLGLRGALLRIRDALAQAEGR